MFERIVVHIGHQKTGTASVQATFHESAAALARHGVFHWTGERNHQLLARAYNAKHREPSDAAIRAAFLKGARRAAGRTAVVSSELLVRLTREEIAAFIADMRPLAGEVAVLCYVRHPVSHASSSAHQAVRTGRRLAEVIARPQIVNVRRILTDWTEAVGRDAMTVRPFDRAQLANGDVVDDVLGAIGIPEAAGELTRVRVNESLSSLGIHLLDRVQAMSGLPSVPRDVARVFEALGGPRYVLPADTLERVRQETAPMLAWLADTWGVALPEPTDTPTAPPALSEAELDSLAQVLGNVVTYTNRCDKTGGRHAATVRAPYMIDPRPEPRGGVFGGGA